MKGSVVKRCTCPPVLDERGRRKTCPKKHGSWSYVADVGVDQRKQVKRGGFPTREAAEEALAALLRQVKNHGWTDDQSVTLVGWLTEWVDRQESSGKIRASTARGYRDHVDGRIVAHFGARKLRDVKRAQVTAFIASMVKAGAGPTTVHRTLATLRSGLTAAVRAGMIPLNPGRDVDLPGRDVKTAAPWTPDELGAFLDGVQTDRLGVLFELLAMTGMRRGEALGLSWRDVDLGAGTVTVRRQAVPCPPTMCPVCCAEHGVIFTEPKTDAGVRLVELDRATVGALLGHRLRQDTERNEWADAYTDHGLLFCREDGWPVHPSTITHRFAELTAAITTTGDDGQRVPLRPIKLHDLRHGAASLGLAAGVPLEVISKRLGHSSVTVTSAVYSHLLPGVGRQAAEATAALVNRSARRDPSEAV